MDILSEHGCFGGTVRFLRHEATTIGLPMRFSVFLPPQAAQAGTGGGTGGGAGPRRPGLPALFFLAGLTCTEETAMAKAGAQRLAAELGLVLVMPDTSPRGAGVPGESDSWDFGVGAGFYLDATEPDWARHYRMESWICEELVPLVARDFGVDPTRLGISGHSMGGHGALTLALRRPGLFRTVSALAPICAPSVCPWGIKAFTGYLGPDRQAWQQHDASALMARQTTAPYPGGILVDQGLADRFLAEQLLPERFEAACAQVGQPLTLRRHEGYDHGYYFIASFIDEHLRFHARGLGGS